MKDKLFNYLKSFMIENNWEDCNIAKQARGTFTAICLVGNIDADTAECDNMLHELYDVAVMEDIMGYDDFESFMIELIV